ncbi:hypothetical protein GCM10010277_34450 [Streptomyces longisporoflavus]|uniref:DUF3152 domain-containing protein n=1 Tax=Streptomyces longisporoflavus TaxID=28044 RepID=UPI00167EF718|nr:DUF3152 domain-containing protein [Streptomyces longisporoflavus]GGV44211.1 hypothetical protein GCM10010277_34450 [Streptomyces longisporoflavus]
MGRHSRRGSTDLADNTGSTGSTGSTDTTGITSAQGARPPGPGTGRRRRAPGDPGTPAHGIPQATPPHGVPQATPPRGVPQATPPRGTPQATPPHGSPHVRGGHPEQREPGGGWGSGPRSGAVYGVPGARTAPPRMPGPRREYVDAFGDEFDEDDLFATGTTAGPATATGPPPRDPYASVTDWDRAVDEDEEAHGELWSAADGSDGPGGITYDEDENADEDGKGGGKGRTYAGIAAAAVTTVLAVVVAGQVTGGSADSVPRTQVAKGQDPRAAGEDASRSDDRPTPPESAPATYETKMAKKYPLDAKLTASGDFEAMAGFDKAPGKGQKFRYRVDVEKGMGLDGELFASAVQKTLNDDRSWAHGGGRTFERISSGQPDFVITLASPGTTGKWCAKSGLDTLEQNVSCDSAATDRVMINAYRWAQGAETYGDRIYPYRQMLINHEVGHRLGFNHTDCTKDGQLAPVMQQQTKFLDHDGIKCKANPWAFPKS